MSPANTPVVFVHGLWLHATSWDPWVDLFREGGYAPQAPGWPGDSDTVEETRRHPERVAGKGIDDVVAHYAQIIRGLDAPPIVIGHSFGGIIVQRLLGQDLAAAAVALTREQWRYGFGNALPAQESDELYDRCAIPSPGKTLFEAAFAAVTPNSPAKVDTRNKTRGPLLITAGGRDHTVPHVISTQTRRLYHRSPAITDLKEFPDRGHSLTIDHGWREVAQAALDWLKQRSL